MCHLPNACGLVIFITRSLGPYGPLLLAPEEGIGGIPYMSLPKIEIENILEKVREVCKVSHLQ